jgi:hypothetical protein
MLGAQVGIMRQVQNLKRGAKSTYGQDGSNLWQLHIEGALAEMAVSKYLDYYWWGRVGNYNASDVSQSIEVRHSANHKHRLILHDRDNDNSPFILVTGGIGQYILQGWIMGKDGKQPQYYKDPTGNNRPAYFVPREVLKPIEALLW